MADYEALTALIDVVGLKKEGKVRYLSCAGWAMDRMLDSILLSDCSGYYCRLYPWPFGQQEKGGRGKTS